MKILVLCYSVSSQDRNTQNEHLYSFSHYADAKVDYLNVFFGISPLLRFLKYDLIVFHYTFMSIRWNGVLRFKQMTRRLAFLKNASAVKVALPQDEYLHSEAVCDFLNEFNVGFLFTCGNEISAKQMYPATKLKKTQVRHTFPGFVDSRKIEDISRSLIPNSHRPIDVGYRARSLPYWLGWHGQLKIRVAEIFSEALKYSKMKVDISVKEEDTFLGDSWPTFLKDCRVVLGCEGGASLHDPVGLIRKKVDDYLEKNPQASFEEVQKKCFLNLDNNLALYAISPRHFESAMTKTCQVLVEGEYNGVLVKDVHYISVDPDFSNLQQVIQKIEDKAYCEKIAENAYRDLILSGKYTYAHFVAEIISLVPPVRHSTKNSVVSKALGHWLFCLAPKFVVYPRKLNYLLRVVVVRVLRKLKLHDHFKEVRTRILGYRIDV